MPDVRMGVGVKFHINLGNYQSADYDILVSGIDPNAPLQPQLAPAATAFPTIAANLEQMLMNQMQASGALPVVRANKQ